MVEKHFYCWIEKLDDDEAENASNLEEVTEVNIAIADAKRTIWFLRIVHKEKNSNRCILCSLKRDLWK